MSVYRPTKITVNVLTAFTLAKAALERAAVADTVVVVAIASIDCETR